MPAGKYAIVPATMKPGAKGKFWLSIYYSIDKQFVKHYKAEDPNNTGIPIQEEEEIDRSLITDDIVNSIKGLVSHLLNQ